MHGKILLNEDISVIEKYNGKTFNEIFMYVVIIAMLHDVADHKYDTYETLKTQIFKFVKY